MGGVTVTEEFRARIRTLVRRAWARAENPNSVVQIVGWTRADDGPVLATIAHTQLDDPDRMVECLELVDHAADAARRRSQFGEAESLLWAAFTIARSLRYDQFDDDFSFWVEVAFGLQLEAFEGEADQRLIEGSL